MLLVEVGDASAVQVVPTAHDSHGLLDLMDLLLDSSFSKIVAADVTDLTPASKVRAVNVRR